MQLAGLQAITVFSLGSTCLELLLFCVLCRAAMLDHVLDAPGTCIHCAADAARKPQHRPAPSFQLPALFLQRHPQTVNMVAMVPREAELNGCHWNAVVTHPSLKPGLDRRIIIEIILRVQRVDRTRSLPLTASHADSQRLHHPLLRQEFAVYTKSADICGMRESLPMSSNKSSHKAVELLDELSSDIEPSGNWQ